MDATGSNNIFLSYRREDSEGQAGRLYDRLNAAFPGRIFRDVSGIAIGVNFAQKIEEAIKSSKVVLAVIGRRWATVESENQERRLFQPKDYVHQEIASAFTRGLAVIPVLVDGAKIPSESDLPEDIQALSSIQGVEITPVDYDHDVKRLIEALESFVGKGVGSEDRQRTRTEFESLVRKANACVAMEDWMSAIQNLQSANSLDPADLDVARQLRIAREQMQLSGLYADGQRLYQFGQKREALERFRQVRAAGGSYKNVDQLIGLLESEIRPASQPVPVKKSNRKWWYIAGAAVIVLGLIGQVMEKIDRPTNPVQGAVNSPRLTFSAAGRWRIYRENQPGYVLLTFFPNGQFQLENPQGMPQFPANTSGGAFRWDPSGVGVVALSGVDSMGRQFQFGFQGFDPQPGHVHVGYGGAQWAMQPA